MSRHIYSNSVDRASIRKLLERVFVQCKCKEKECIKHEVAFQIEDTVSSLDMKQENIQTLLCYLELNTNKLIRNLPLSYIHCKVTCYKGPLFLKKLSKTVSNILILPSIQFLCVIVLDPRSFYLEKTAFILLFLTHSYFSYKM